MEAQIITYRFDVFEQRYFTTNSLKGFPNITRCKSIRKKHFRKGYYIDKDSVELIGKNFRVAATRINTGLQYIGDFKEGIVILDIHPRRYIKIFFFPDKKLIQKEEPQIFATTFLKNYFAQKTIQCNRILL